MDTRLLEDALVLLEEGSLNAAAARRNVTQPAFSRRIRALENWIGRDLLVRGPNSVVISPSLAACQPQIRAMLDQLRAIRSQLRTLDTAPEPLVFASQHSLSLSIFPEICRTLAADCPEVVARLRTQNQDVATSLFLRREADVLIGYEHRGYGHMPFDDSILRILWRRDVLVPIVGHQWRDHLTTGARLPPSYPVIRYPPDSFFGQMIGLHETRAAIRLEGPTAVESAFSMAISRLVCAAVGASWVPHSIVHDDIMSGNAVILSADYGRIPLDIVLFVNRSNSQAVRIVEGLSGLRTPRDIDPEAA